jgi:hypothetical protein
MKPAGDDMDITFKETDPLISTSEEKSTQPRLGLGWVKDRILCKIPYMYGEIFILFYTLPVI